jgi:HK97 family phage major capsid protein
MSETSTEVQESVAVGTTKDGTEIVLDMGKIFEKLDEKTKESIEKYTAQLKEYYEKDKDGKAVIQERLGKNTAKLIEQLRNVANAAVTESWTITIPNYTTKEIAGHLRDYVWVAEQMSGKKGDIAYIPYVKDFDLTTSSSVGDASPEVTSIINETSTTLKEGSAYTQVQYHLLERYDDNLLDTLNATFARAAVRTEDYNLMVALHNASSDTQFAGKTNRGTYADFDYTFVLDGITALMGAGKDVKPGELVLWIHPKAYGYLLKDIVGTEALTIGRPDIVQKGLMEDFLGVHIVVGGLMPGKARKGTGTGTVYPAYLFRAKRALALAPKRDMLIETDRDVVAKKLKVACSHTFGVKALDFKEAYRIFTDTKA